MEMRVLVIIFTLIPSLLFAQGYTKVRWDPPVDYTPDKYQISRQNCNTGYIKEFETGQLFYLLSDMLIEDNVKYKMWVKAFKGDILSKRSNEIYYDSRMPLPPENGRLIE